MHNVGRIEHKLTLVPLPDDFPPVDVQRKRVDDPKIVDPVAGTLPVQPGDSASFAVDLAPVRYGVYCFIVEPKGRQHYRIGMVAEFRAR